MRLHSGPLTTAAPPVAAVLQRLFNRQVGEVTCGWGNEDYYQSIVCAINSVCLLNTISNGAGCCPSTSTDCVLPTACLDYTNPAIPADSWTGKCSSASPYCDIGIISGYDFGIWGCGVTPTTELIYSTYTNGPENPPIISASFYIQGPASISASQTSAPQTSASYSSILTSSNPTAAVTTAVAGSSTGQNAEGGSGFSSPGAIAGYTIAGSVIALIGLYFTWKQYNIAKKNRREQRAAGQNYELNILQR